MTLFPSAKMSPQVEKELSTALTGIGEALNIILESDPERNNFLKIDFQGDTPESKRVLAWGKPGCVVCVSSDPDSVPLGVW